MCASSESIIIESDDVISAALKAFSDEHGLTVAVREVKGHAGDPTVWLRGWLSLGSSSHNRRFSAASVRQSASTTTLAPERVDRARHTVAEHFYADRVQPCPRSGCRSRHRVEGERGVHTRRGTM